MGLFLDSDRAMRVSREYYDGGGSSDPLAEAGDADELRCLIRAPCDAVHQLHAVSEASGRTARRCRSATSPGGGGC